jgi:hypothetical protein
VSLRLGSRTPEVLPASRGGDRGTMSRTQKGHKHLCASFPVMTPSPPHRLPGVLPVALGILGGVGEKGGDLVDLMWEQKES